MSFIAAPPACDPAPGDADDDVIAALVAHLADGLDHPELWAEAATVLAVLPTIRDQLGALDATGWGDRLAIGCLCAVFDAAASALDAGLARMQVLAADHSQSALAQGALFWIEGLAARAAGQPADRFGLAGRVCPTPFRQFDVLDGSTHLCCASWLQQSAGDLTAAPWREVWNGPQAQAIRASIWDGSYRYCNKTACPRIQAGDLPLAADLAATDPVWAERVAARAVVVERGPDVVNLAYDRTCNLACPSCRVGHYAADRAERQRFAALQEQAILPMLREARLVCVTGSGDPFASKNFRDLIAALDAGRYPDLRFQIMTNAMLFTPAQWAAFPQLHGRVAELRVSTDGASAATHEALRLGSRWEVVCANMAFARDLRRRGAIDSLNVVFTVQAANFREMGAAVDLAREWGADGIDFGRMTNWGTFSDAQYRAMAVFLPEHPDHDEFLDVLGDPRLDDPMVLLRDLAGLRRTATVSARQFRQ